MFKVDDSNFGPTHGSEILLDFLSTSMKELSERRTDSFNCKICNISFQNDLVYSKHKLLHESNTCGGIVVHKSGAKISFPGRYDTGVGTYSLYNRPRTCDIPKTCDICNVTLSSEKCLRRHKKFVHAKDIKYLPCEVCGKLFKTAEILRYHLKWIHADTDQTVECDICKKKLKTVHKLKQHKRIVHSNAQIPCDICGKIFNSESYLKTHMISVHSDKSSKICAVCGKSVKDLPRHMMSHSVGNGTPCDICGKVLSSKVGVELHKKNVHVNLSRDHVCETCGAAFKTKDVLRSHFRTHSEERKFKCEVCNKAFKSRCTLTTHSRMHGNSDPYECKICGETFLWRSSFNKHAAVCSEGNILNDND